MHTPGDPESGVFTYGRSVIPDHQHLRHPHGGLVHDFSCYLIRRVMHRGWAYLSYALALVLLLTINFSCLSPDIPIWVLIISSVILIRTQGVRPEKRAGHEIKSPFMRKSGNCRTGWFFMPGLICLNRRRIRIGNDLIFLSFRNRTPSTNPGR
jgi:hypothetical protein